MIFYVRRPLARDAHLPGTRPMLIVITATSVFLSRATAAETEAAHADLVTSLGPWSAAAVSDWLAEEYPDLEPSAAEQVLSFLASGTVERAVTFARSGDDADPTMRIRALTTRLGGYLAERLGEGDDAETRAVLIMVEGLFDHGDDGPEVLLRVGVLEGLAAALLGAGRDVARVAPLLPGPASRAAWESVLGWMEPRG